jgi:hypothetical protein
LQGINYPFCPVLFTPIVSQLMLTHFKNKKLSSTRILRILVSFLPLALASCYPGVPDDFSQKQNPYSARPTGGAYQQGGQAPYYSGPTGGYNNQNQQNQQQYQQPIQQQQRQQYQQQAPGSRYYSNPYSIQQPQPTQNRYPYYDGDQYYVPPSYYDSPDAIPYSNDISKF